MCCCQGLNSILATRCCRRSTPSARHQHGRAEAGTAITSVCLCQNSKALNIKREVTWPCSRAHRSVKYGSRKVLLVPQPMKPAVWGYWPHWHEHWGDGVVTSAGSECAQPCCIHAFRGPCAPGRAAFYSHPNEAKLALLRPTRLPASGAPRSFCFAQSLLGPLRLMQPGNSLLPCASDAEPWFAVLASVLGVFFFLFYVARVVVVKRVCLSVLCCCSGFWVALVCKSD